MNRPQLENAAIEINELIFTLTAALRKSEAIFNYLVTNKAISGKYSEDGFDSDGYDRYGCDKFGVNREGFYESEVREY